MTFEKVVSQGKIIDLSASFSSIYNIRIKIMCAHEDTAKDLQTALRKRCTETVIAESIIMGCLNTAGFASSMLICLSIYGNVRLRSAVHMYILSYAIIDLLKSMFVMPFTFGVVIKGEWISTAPVCQFQGYVISGLDIATTLTITMTAIDRYVANSHLAQYVTLFKRKHVCGVLVVSWLISFAVPLSFTIKANDFVLHPGYGICRQVVTNASFLSASILKIIFSVLPFIIIVACFYSAKVNMQRTNKTTALRAKEGRMVNTTTWMEQEASTRLFAAFTLGILVFWVPSYVCDVVDAFTHEYYLPRSIYLLSTLIANASCFTKSLIVASMNEVFLIEFKRIFKLRTSRRVVNFNIEANGEEEKGSKLMAQTRNCRKYDCEMKESEDGVKGAESTA